MSAERRTAAVPILSALIVVAAIAIVAVGVMVSRDRADDKSAAGGWPPALVEEGGVPTGFDFTGVAEPSGELEVEVVTEGDGAVVEAGQTINVNYLGMIRGEDAPFDESYSSGAPVPFPIGVGAVIPGFDQALVGRTLGSRVIMEIPPDLGYGEAGQGPIPPNATLYFVVDLVSVADTP